MVIQNDKAIFFQEAAKCICGSLELEETIKRCFEYLKGCIPMDDIWFIMFDDTINTLRFIAYADLSGVKKIDKVIPLTSFLRNEIDKLNRILVISQAELNPITKYLINYFNLPESSLMVLPLVPDYIRIGAFVTIRKTGQDQYSDLHAELFTMLHDLFAIFLSNSLKYGELTKIKNLIADDKDFFEQELRQVRGNTIVGADSGLEHVMGVVRKVALLNTPVLLLGETGVGKELIAHAIHNYSNRKDGPFITVNSGAIPETLIDSELFGHEKGAFTGATSKRRGRFERAAGGTIFLDEIGDLPRKAQVRLLRVIQQKEFERVGGSETITVDTRIVAATHRNLEQMIEKNEFREDLWYRLSVCPIVIPPLRQRKEDIPELLKYFLIRKSKDLNINKIPSLDPYAIANLMDYSWKGNVRELENIVEKALIHYTDGLLSFDKFIIPHMEKEGVFPTIFHSSTPTTMNEISARYIQSVLETTHGKVNGPKGAAKILGIHPSTLRLKMDKLNIPYGRKWKKSI